MQKCLVYNFTGELDDVSVLFPNERLARIAAIIARRGVDVRVLDRANLADLEAFGGAYMARLAELDFEGLDSVYAAGVEREADGLADGEYDTVFLHLWSGTGFKFTMDLARALKHRNPAIRLFGIGPKVDWFAEHILALPGNALDGLVTGLGYDAVEALCAGKPHAEIPGLIFLRGEEAVINPKQVVDVDAYPAPDYRDTVYGAIGEKVPVFPVTLSNQACPNHCVFCIRPTNYGMRVRARSLTGVLDDMITLYRDHGATHFRVEDSTPPRGALTCLARAILDSELAGKIRLSAFSRVDSNAVEDFELMRRAGFLALFFGLESLDDAMLTSLRKGFVFEDARQTLGKAHAAGLFTVGSFIFPLPGETAASMANTLQRIAMLRPVLDSVLTMPTGVHPPTAWGREPERFGIRLAPDYVRQGLLYPIRYAVPIRHWRPLPYTYPLMGKPAEAVTFDDVVAAQEAFLKRVRGELGLAGVPDYSVLVGDLLRTDPGEAARAIVRCLMERDYHALRALFARAR